MQNKTNSNKNIKILRSKNQQEKEIDTLEYQKINFIRNGQKVSPRQLNYFWQEYCTVAVPGPTTSPQST